MGFNKNIRMELPEDAVVFERPTFDNSIIAVTTDGRAVYDYNKMVTELMMDDGVSEEEAIDWIEYHSLRTIPYAGEMAPVVVIMLEGDDTNG